MTIKRKRKKTLAWECESNHRNDAYVRREEQRTVSTAIHSVNGRLKNSNVGPLSIFNSMYKTITQAKAA